MAKKKKQQTTIQNTWIALAALVFSALIIVLDRVDFNKKAAKK